ncbi:hypothetical protein G7Y89_g6582 [Cudoniella acicularis]|uniref:HD domain-containing protein n=1 Tax=Cudoniella acicularis TaxID=354080 RepID=A0A8H4W4L9_9HELO|nr:hypothetical protein G7Y89_g6582 [Cudoniella acicularis]
MFSSNSEREAAIQTYGWTPVPHDLDLLLKQHSEAPSGAAAPIISVSSIPLPPSELAKKVHEYAKKELPVETYNHCLRVYYFGQAILQHVFPSWKTDTFDEMYFLTCLLHDIGTTDKNITSTLMSFEFAGALLSHTLLTSLSSPPPQTENITESIIRHQDIGTEGTQTRISALTQLATIYDNMGLREELVARGTIEEVVGKWPRRGWSGCFARTLRRENGLKGWSNSRRLGENAFPEGVENNKLMAPYDAAT